MPIAVSILTTSREAPNPDSIGTVRQTNDQREFRGAKTAHNRQRKHSTTVRSQFSNILKHFVRQIIT